MGQFLEMNAEVVVDISALLTKNKKEKPDADKPKDSDKPVEEDK